MSFEQEQPSHSSERVLEEVTATVQTRLIEQYRPSLGEMLKFKLNLLNKNIILERASERACETASVDMVVALCTRFPDLFPVTSLLTSRNPRLPLKGGWAYHTGVLLYDKEITSVDGLWYLVSPANYNSTKDKSPIKDADLQAVLDEFQREEGGVWPSADYILSSLENGTFAKPEIRRHETSKGLITNRLSVTRFVHQVINGEESDLAVVDDAYVR